MISLPPDRAKTLKAAFQACDVGPLVGKNKRFYVPLASIRSPEAIQGVRSRLNFLEAGSGVILFTGHRGCGKSTELHQIQQDFESMYRVIYLEADKELDINDADYTDLYLVIIKQVTDDLTKLGLQFDRRLLQSFEQWFLEVTDETTESVERSVSLETSAEVGAEIPFISKLLAKLLAQIKGSNTRKKTIRQILQRDVGRLQADINYLLKDAFDKLRQAYTDKYQKGFLLIFDNLDRVPPAVGDRLYLDYAAQLQELNCTIIYTVPISVVHSDKNLNNTFGRPNIVPMVNIYRFEQSGSDLTYEDAVIKQVALLVAYRMDLKAVFDNPASVLELAKASGGHVRQLMQMTANACIVADARGRSRIKAEDVTYAIKQEQFNFERVIPEHHYPILAQVCLTKRIDQNADGQRMLFNTSVLEYNGETRWNYINPVVKQSNVFQQALRSALDSSNT
jgi:hypothetical protein